MSYTPTNWSTGDTITATKLNNIEQGISSIDMIIVNLTDNGTGTYVADKTAAQMFNAFITGKKIIIKWPSDFVDYENNPLTVYDIIIHAECNGTDINNSDYYQFASNSISLHANAPNEYPKYYNVS